MRSSVCVTSLMAATLAAGYFYLIAPRSKRDAVRAPFRVAYAHRGLHGDKIPENSLSAFRAAVESGYGIELDLQLSKDGQIMVFHDDNLLRMTGRDALLSDLSAEELRTLRLKNTDEKIPYFSEVLELVNGKVPLLIELKGTSRTDVTLCVKTEILLRSYVGLWCIESFNPMQIRWWKRNRPDVVRGQLVTNLIYRNGKWSKNPVDFLLSGLFLNVYSRPDFVAADRNMKNPSVFLACKVFGADRFVWTVKGKKACEEALCRHRCPIFELREEKAE